MNKSSVVIIGLGRFGSSLAQSLTERGHDVLGLDRDMRRVEDAVDFVTQATQVDATDESALKDLGVTNFDIGVVSIGGDVKSSVMISLLLERLGLKRVVAKASDELHGEILARIGVETVVFPERDTGSRFAHTMLIPNAVDYMEVMPGYGLAKLTVPQPFVGKHLEDLDLRGKFAVSVLILQRKQDVIVNPSKYEILGLGDTLILGGHDESLEAIQDVISELS